MDRPFQVPHLATVLKQIPKAFVMKVGIQMEALWRKQEKYKILQIHKMLHLLNLSRTLKNLWFSKKKNHNNSNDNNLILKEIPSVTSKQVHVMKKHVLIAWCTHVLLTNIWSLGWHLTLMFTCKVRRRLFVDLICFPSTKYSSQEFLDVEKSFWSF